MITTLLVIATWVGFEIYHQSRGTTLPKVVQQQIEPIDTNLPTDFLNELEARQKQKLEEHLKY